MRRLVLIALAALALAAPAAASEQNPTLPDLEDEVMCPTCKTTLALSNAPAADQIRRLIRARIRAGDTKSEIKAKLVAEFGPGVLAEPRKEGFDLLAWLLPLLGAAVAAAALAVGVRRWTRPREPEPAANGRRPPDPELERRLDDELARYG